eukprot:17126-Heterococcus_DN1.PRE.3
MVSLPHQAAAVALAAAVSDQHHVTCPSQLLLLCRVHALLHRPVVVALVVVAVAAVTVVAVTGCQRHSSCLYSCSSHHQYDKGHTARARDSVVTVVAAAGVAAASVTGSYCVHIAVTLDAALFQAVVAANCSSAATPHQLQRSVQTDCLNNCEQHCITGRHTHVPHCTAVIIAAVTALQLTSVLML